MKKTKQGNRQTPPPPDLPETGGLKALENGRIRLETGANHGGLARNKAGVTEVWPSAPQLETSYAGCVAGKATFASLVEFAK